MCEAKESLFECQTQNDITRVGKSHTALPALDGLTPLVPQGQDPAAEARAFARYTCAMQSRLARAGR